MRAVSWAMAAGLLLAAACGNEGSQRLAEPVTIEGDAILTPLGGETGDASRGKAVFTDREQGHCVLCHAVAGLEAEFQGNVGPPLTGLGDRLSPGQIRLRVADAQRIWPQRGRPRAMARSARGLPEVQEHVDANGGTTIP